MRQERKSARAVLMWVKEKEWTWRLSSPAVTKHFHSLDYRAGSRGHTVLLTTTTHTHTHSRPTLHTHTHTHTHTVDQHHTLDPRLPACILQPVCPYPRRTIFLQLTHTDNTRTLGRRDETHKHTMILTSVCPEDRTHERIEPKTCKALPHRETTEFPL